MTTAKGKVLEKILQYNGEIANRAYKISKMKRVLYKSERLNKFSDIENRINLNNDRFIDPNHIFSDPDFSWDIGKGMSNILAFADAHLATMNDPLVDGILELYDQNYAIFSFGKVYDDMLLSKILERKIPMNEYLAYLSGSKPIAERDGQLYHIKMPTNYAEIVVEYKKSHPDVFFGTFKSGPMYVGKLVG